MEYNNLINELLDILDKDENIIKIKELKNKLLNDQKLLEDIKNVNINPSIDGKKNLFNYIDYKEYLRLESNINLIILSIKQKLNFSSRSCLK